MDFFLINVKKYVFFFKSRGVNVALFLLYLILYIEYPP